MITNKIESKLIKSVSVMIGMFVLQLALFNTGLYTHLQAQMIFTGSFLVQVIASIAACFFLGWLLIDKVISKDKRVSVNDTSFKNGVAKKKTA